MCHVSGYLKEMSNLHEDKELRFRGDKKVIAYNTLLHYSADLSAQFYCLLRRGSLLRHVC